MLQLSSTAQPADEIDALARSGIADSEQRIQNHVLQPAHVQTIGRRIRTGLTERDRVPFAAQEHRDISSAHRRRGAVVHRESLTNGFQKRVWRSVAEIGHEPVVRKYAHCCAGNATARNVSHSPAFAPPSRNCWRARAALAAR
jgi:hypothetical protein